MPVRQRCPLPVLEQIQEEFLDFKGTGMSITEVSHRSKAVRGGGERGGCQRTRRLLNLGSDFHVLFIQGGASLQFTMVPMNLAVQGKPVDYINTGTWATKAIKEAKILKKDVRVIASSEDKNFSYIPKTFSVTKDAAYLHFTSNNTIKGTQWVEFPKAGDVPLVSDMSSDFMSRPFDARPFGLIYAGAQKNIGPAGTALVIIRKDMLEEGPGRSAHHAEVHHLLGIQFPLQHPFLLYHLHHQPGPEVAGGDHRRRDGHGKDQPGKGHGSFTRLSTVRGFYRGTR